MNLGRTLPLLLGGLLVASATAQINSRDRREPSRDRDHDRERGPRVILYQDAEYRGDRLVLYPGDSLDNLSGQTFPGGAKLNDGISSIRVEGGAEVYVHADARFRGAVLRLTESARNLTGRLLPGSTTTSWNDRISSLRVEQRRRDESRAEPEVIVQRAYRDLLGREPDPTGLRDYRSLILDQGWSERMVRDNIRRGDEYRREGADRIVQRAYRDVLGREVDPEGLRHFRRQLLERNWTEGDVRDALRRSDEYKKTQATPPPGEAARDQPNR
jgi:hypothetical protein